MVTNFDPRTGANRSVANARITHPVRQSDLTSARPNTLQNATHVMHTWEQVVAEFEMKNAKKGDEDAKIMVSNSIMQEKLFGAAGAFSSTSLRICTQLSSISWMMSVSVNDEAGSANISNEHGSHFEHEIEENEEKIMSP